MINKIKKKCVLFDLDGVITNTMPYHYIAWKKVLLDKNIKVTKEDIYLREGQTGKQAIFEIIKKYNKSLNNNEFNSLLKSKEDHFKKICKIKFIIGSRNFIKNLHKKNILLGLVTGTSRHELEKFFPQKMINLFDVIITSSDVTNGKPHPEPYKKALKSLNVSTKDAIVIENAPLGILSAKLAGIECIAIETSLPQRYLSKADYIFKSFNDINSKIEIV